MGHAVRANIRLPGIRFKKLLWHGVGSHESWKKICSGEGLKLPSVHAHDVGDWGYGVYFTDSEIRARVYSKKLPSGKMPLVRAVVSLENAVYINWRVGSPLDPKHPAWAVLNVIKEMFGDPVRGGTEARARAAREWRTGLLGMGVDGIVSLSQHDTEVVVYDPKKSILKYKCTLGEAR